MGFVVRSVDSILFSILSFLNVILPLGIFHRVRHVQVHKDVRIRMLFAAQLEIPKTTAC